VIAGLIGEREVLREQVTKSRGGGVIFATNHLSVSTSMHQVTESAVLPSELGLERRVQLSGRSATTPLGAQIKQLPDLQGF
jgi:hypothetical protein